MLLYQLTNCDAILMFMLSKLFQGKYLLYFPWFSQNEKKKKRKEEMFTCL